MTGLEQNTEHDSQCGNEKADAGYKLEKSCLRNIKIDLRKESKLKQTL